MFTRCYADNFRCLSSFELPLESLSVLLGPNGSGKSTMLSLFAKLRDFILGRGTSLELFPPETLTRWDQRTEQTFEWSLRLEQGLYVYRLRITHEPKQALNKVVEESLAFDGHWLYKSDDQKITLYNDWYGGGAQLLPDWHVSGISRVHERADNQKLTAFRRAIENVLILALNPSLVGAVSAEKQPVLIPEPDCSDFASWLLHISNTEPLARQEAEQSLARGGLPGFRAFKADPSGDANILKCIFQSGSSRSTFRLDELSSGQIAMVILETALAVASERRCILMLDEPGNFLGLSEVQPLLTRLQDAALEGRLQAILTAHHSTAIDLLAAGHGLWLEREPSGPTRPPQRIHVAEDIAEGKAVVRISDLVARGWLSALGVAQPGSAIVSGESAAREAHPQQAQQ